MKQFTKRTLALLMVLVLCLGLLPSTALAFNADNYKANITKISVGAPITGTDGKKYLPVDVHFTANEDLGNTNAVYFLEGYLKATLANGTTAQGVSGLGMTLIQTDPPGLKPENSNQYGWSWNDGTGMGILRYNVPLLESNDTQSVETSQATGQEEVNGLKVGDKVGLSVETILKGVPDTIPNPISDEFTFTIEDASNYPKEITVSEGGGSSGGTATIPTGKTLTYSGEAQTGVDAGTGYTLSGTYQATNAGSYTATATLVSGYKWSDNSTGTKRISWKIDPAALTELGSLDTVFTYNGQVQKPSEAGLLVYAVSGAPGAEAGSYTISYSNANSKNVGTYTVTATGAGNFTGSVSKTYKIDPVAITGITLSAEAFEFTGQVQKPTVQSITTSNGVALTTNDYTIDIPNSSAVGRYTVTVTGKNNATGTQTAQYVIETEKDLSKATVVGLKKDENGNVDDNQTYTKEEAECIGLKYGGKTLIPGEGKDYIKTVAAKEGDSTKWEIKAEPIEGKTKGQRTIEVKKAGNDVHNVTIHYLYAGTGEVAAPTFLQSYEKGASFAVRSPQLADGSIASNGIIVGTMGDNNLEYTVTYSSMTAATLFTVDVVYTVEYKDGDTTTATPKPVRLYLEDLKTYSITSPEVAGYKPTIQVVQGKVNHENVIVEVRYKPAYTLHVQMIVKGHNGGADEEYGDREIPMYAGESYDFVPYLFYGDTSTDVALIGGIEAAVNENYTPDPARVTGVMPAHDVTVTVTYTCKHSKTIWKNDGESGHHLECCICSSTLKTEPHDLGAGVYVSLAELFEDANDVSEYNDIREDYPNGATLKSCSKCSYRELDNPDEERCPASPADENYKHLWGSWEKISDTQCQRTCYRCKTVETGNHDWSNWQYASTATHYRICNHCHVTESANHGGWSNINVTQPATCIAHASVDAHCLNCNQDVHGVYYGILKDMPKSNLLPTGHQFDGGWVNIHGGHTQKCSVCGAFDMEHWEAHAWSDDGETATGQCGNGTVTQHFVCRCGATKHEDSAWEHNWWHDVKRESQATCEQAGTECYTCRNCGAHDDKQVNALGHVWVEDEGNYAASCTEPGYMSFHCDRPNCLATKGGYIPALHPEGHKMEPFSINTSTCTIGGYLTTGQKCAYCGYTENTKDEPVDKLGHSMKETEQKVDWRSRVIYQNGRPAVVNEEVFYVTRECTRCGYCAPGHLYTVARSEQLSRYKIETGNVKVHDLDEGSGGVKVSGQFGKDGGIFFEKTVNDAYQSRKEIDRKVYEQHEGSVITTFTEAFLKSLEDGEYDFIQINGDELAAARVTVSNGQVTGVEDGIINANPNKPENQMLPEEYLFYLGAADLVLANTPVPVIEGFTALALGANSYPVVLPNNAVYDQRTSSDDHKDVMVIKYDKGHTFDANSPISLFGNPVPATEMVQVSVYNEQTKQMDVSQEQRTNYTIDDDRITFTTAYLDSLGEGPHDFQINYTGDVPPALLVINVTASAQPVNPGGGGGGGGGAATYAPTITETEHGKVTVKPERAASGDTVYITVTPDEGYELDALTVTDAGGNEVALTKNADGTYSYVQPAGKVTITAIFKETASAFANPFDDVSEGNYFYDAVMWAVQNGVTKGTDDTHFTPNGRCSRAATVTFLWRAEGCPEPGSTVNPFEDVKANDYYYKAVLWAVETGVTNGTDATHFSPGTPTTREQFATFLYRCAKSHGKGFTGMWAFPLDFPDAGKVSDWAYEAMCWMVMNGVVNGMDGRLNPKGNALRAHVMCMIYRFYNLD